MRGSGGIRTFASSSNRAPFYTDATIDTSLLAANASKTVTPAYTDTDTTPVIAQSVLIINSSAQPATVKLKIARSDDAKAIDIMTNAVTIVAGESFEIKARILSITEKNTGSAAQSSPGVRYLFDMESTK